tara:strand:- start:12952 stop:13614 length:663 start_codon:yes stop_codon:yes gene_type:complete
MTTFAECGWPYYFASLVEENQETYGEVSSYYIGKDTVCRRLTVETDMLNFDIEMMAAIQSPDTTVKPQGVWIEIDNDNLQEYMDMPIEVGMLIYVVRKGVGWGSKDQVIYIQATTDSFEEGEIQYFRGSSDTEILAKPSILKMEIQEYNAKQYSSIRKRNPDYVVTLGNVLSDFAFLKKIEREYQIIPSLNSEITLFARLNDRNDAPIIPMNYAKGGVWL